MNTPFKLISLLVFLLSACASPPPLPAADPTAPGAAAPNLDFTVRYSLNRWRLRIEMAALVSEATPINMVQHNYFNLLGQGDVLDHNFRILGETYTPLSPALIPTGEIVPVGGTPFDFRSGRTLRDSDGTPRAYDINLGLGVKDPEKNPAAVVTAPDRSLTLRLWSAQPGLQLYTGAYLNSLDAGLGDIHYKQYGGFCLEDQMFPDALNHPNFPSIVVSPEKPYTHWCEIEIN